MEVTDAENLSATELRLGLPGTSSSSSISDDNNRSKKSPSSAVAGAKRALDETRSEAASGTGCTGTAAGDDRQDTATPPAKAQVVGWPPVRAYRKNTTIQSAAAAAKKHHQAEQQQKQPQPAGGAAGGGGLYVKVSMDGAPYLRKVDLRMYKGYRELRDALDALFFAATTNKSAFEADQQQQYAVAYEDKDGDLMLVGDVPWDMFVSSCKKLRIMRGSEAR